MRELVTIQKQERLNSVWAVDQEGPGGANHTYLVSPLNTILTLSEIQFQTGARQMENSIPGVLDGDLLEIVRDRLIAFQAGPFSSDYNAQALEHIEQALYWLNKRVEDRISRKVLGTEHE